MSVNWMPPCLSFHNNSKFNANFLYVFLFWIRTFSLTLTSETSLNYSPTVMQMFTLKFWPTLLLFQNSNTNSFKIIGCYHHIFIKFCDCIFCGTNKIVITTFLSIFSVFSPSVSQLSQHMWKRYLAHRRTAKSPASVRIHAVLAEPSLFAHTIYGTRGKFKEPEIWPHNVCA